MKATETKEIAVPRFYSPRPHQVDAWQRKRSGKYNYYFKLWHRQAGKDSSDLEEGMDSAWRNPGTQTAYVGLDNVWIAENIFKKTIDGRKFWADYPESLIQPKDTSKEVYFLNNPPELAAARIKFIGFLNDQQLIGSSYDNYIISECSLYRRNAFEYIQPIWEQKEAQGKPLNVCINGTPRGLKNNLYDMLCMYTGVDDPNEFPGEHINSNGSVRCYVDKLRADQTMIMDEKTGEMRRLFSDEQLEVIRQRAIRATGSDNIFRQEYLCDFTATNSGLVYPGVEYIQKENRFTPYNIDTSRPLYAAWDISSKGKVSDATACIVFQFYNNKMFIYDWMEERGKALVECVQSLAQRDYFHLIRLCILPWDSERSPSSETPIEECRRMFPNINWHALTQERVDRGIDSVRRMMPNMIVNKDKCDWVMECFNNYEYKYIPSIEDWSPKPKHDNHSHIMDALRYAVMGIKEIDYLKLNSDGSAAILPTTYEGFYDNYKTPTRNVPTTFRKPVKRTESGIFYY